MRAAIVQPNERTNKRRLVDSHSHSLTHSLTRPTDERTAQLSANSWPPTHPQQRVSLLPLHSLTHSLTHSQHNSNSATTHNNVLGDTSRRLPTHYTTPIDRATRTSSTRHVICWSVISLSTSRIISTFENHEFLTVILRLNHIFPFMGIFHVIYSQSASHRRTFTASH